MKMLDGEPDLLVVEKKGTIYCEEPGGFCADAQVHL